MTRVKRALMLLTSVVVLAAALAVPAPSSPRAMADARVKAVDAAPPDAPPVCPPDAPATGCVHDFPGIASLSLSPVVAALDQPYPACLGPVYPATTPNNCRQLELTLTSGYQMCEFPWSTDCIDSADWGHTSFASEQQRWATGGSPFFTSGIDFRWWPHVAGSSPECPATPGTCDRFFFIGANPTHSQGWIILSNPVIAIRYPAPNDLGYTIQSYRPEAAVRLVDEAANQPPTAGFTVNPDPADPAHFIFQNTSTDPEGDPLDAQWTFGDGGADTRTSPDHSYAKPGKFPVTLTVADPDGNSDSFSLDVVVKAPTLEVDLNFMDGAAPPFDVDQQVTAEVTVRASADGIGKLSDLKFPDGVLTSTPPERFDIGEPTPTPNAAGFDLAPGAQTSFTVELKASTAGQFQLSTRVTGVDAIDRSVTDDAKRDGDIGRELSVTIALAPESFTQEEDATGPKPVDVTVTVTLTNNSNGDITNLNLRSLDASRTRPAQPLNIVQIDGVKPDPISGFPIAGKLEPGQTKDLTAIFRVNDDGEIEFSATATGAGADNSTLFGSGKKVLSAKPKYFIGLKSRVFTPSDNVLLPAGNPIWIKGTVRNLSNTADLELGPLYPELGGNAGIASVAYDDQGTEPRDLIAPQTLRLGPGELKDFTVRITTTWSDPRTNAIVERHGGTQATVKFTPWGRATLEDGTVVDIDPATQVLASQDDLEKVVHIDDSIPIPTTDYLAFGGSILVGTLEGVWGATAALVMSVPDLLKLPYTILRATFQFQSEVWNSFTDDEKDALANDAGLMIAAVLMRNAELGKQGAENLFIQAKAQTLTLMENMADEWEVGDYASTVRAYTSVTANVIATVALPIGLGKLAKTPRAAAVLARAQKALQTRMAPLLAQVRELQLVEDALPILVELASGTELSVAEITRLYGISEEELAELQRLATKYKFLITVRSRHASSIEWIKRGALLKPEPLKVKSMSELDLRLGYPDGKVGSLVFKKPVPLMQWEKNGGSLGEAVNSFVQSRGFVEGSAEWEEAVIRVGERMNEWKKFERQYKQWDKRGWIDVSINYKGNAIDDTVRRGTGKYLGFKLQRIGDEEYVILLLDGKTGRYVPVTGDIDPIAFTHLDGSPLSAADHADLLDDMVKSPILQTKHPESATLKDGGVKFVSDQFKSNEPGLQIAPGGLTPRAVRLNPERSRWTNPRDYNLHWEGGFTYAGKAADGPIGFPPGPDFAAIGAAPSVAAGAEVPRALSGVAAAGEPNMGRCRLTYSNAPGAVPAFLAADGTVAIASIDGSSSPTTFAATCFSEGPQIELTIAPMTILTDSTGTGNPREVAVLNDGTFAGPGPDGFVVGQTVVVGAGSDHPAVRTLTGFGSLIVDQPLAEPHAADDVVIVVANPSPTTVSGTVSGTEAGSESGDELARTGIDVVGIAARGAGLIAVGCVLVFGSRRRRRRRSEVSV